MSLRSKREHKPTSKFLKYSEELSASNKSLKNSTHYKNVLCNPNTDRKRKIGHENTFINNNIVSKKIKSLETSTESKQASNSCLLSEIRRSSRKAKPNEKLKAFAKLSLNHSKDKIDEENLVSSIELSTNEFSYSKGKKLPTVDTIIQEGKGKMIAAVSPMMRTSGGSIPVSLSNNVEILNSSENKVYKDNHTLQQCSQKRKSIIIPAQKAPEKLVIVRKGTSKTCVINKVGSLNGKVVNETGKESVMKSSNLSQKEVRVARKKSLETKALGIINFNPKIQTHIRQRTTKPDVNLILPPTRNRGVVSKVSDGCLNKKNSAAAKISKFQNSPKKDIKDTLQKFLLMGHKVANTISETLKTNEEELLSKSSTFEKKCINLVQSIAYASSDIKEEDMEMILKCLDEEQEERRSYRQTFLESLRVAHLTNMALYSQMIRVLHTL